MLIELYNENITSLFDLLLKDRNTGKNITWCTNDYLKYGENYRADCEITREALNDMGTSLVDLLQPRVTKSKEIQKGRTKERAEVFTPSWVCKEMNDYCEKDWFEKNKKRFDKEVGLVHKDFLKSYIDLRKLEITCGEAPFVVSCYDTVSGNIIPLYNRIGFLDKKLTAICHYIDDMDEWFNWVCRAYESSYGYEYQGDNLFKARLNLIQTFLDYYEKKWNNIGFPTKKQLNKLSNIIVKNFWQMDGLTNTVPNTDIECKVYNWRSKKSYYFCDLRGDSGMKFDYVLGNPPYHYETGRRKIPIYQNFIMGIAGEKPICDVALFITPDGFVKGGQQLEPLREKMIEDKHLKSVQFYQKPVFEGVTVNAAITLFDTRKTFDKIEKSIHHLDGSVEYGELNWQYRDVVIDDLKYEVLKIFESIVEKHPNEVRMSEVIPGRGPFGLSTKFYKENKSKFKNVKDDTYNICILVGEEKDFYWINPNDDFSYEGCDIRDATVKLKNAEKWKLVFPKAGYPDKKELPTRILKPFEIFTDKYLCIFTDSEKEAKNAEKFFKSVFYRAGLASKLTSWNLLRKWHGNIILQDFTENSDIDWDTSIEGIDNQLFKKYNLSDLEIEKIRKYICDKEV